MAAPLRPPQLEDLLVLREAQTEMVERPVLLLRLRLRIPRPRLPHRPARRVEVCPVAFLLYYTHCLPDSSCANNFAAQKALTLLKICELVLNDPQSLQVPLEAFR